MLLDRTIARRLACDPSRCRRATVDSLADASAVAGVYVCRRLEAGKAWWQQGANGWGYRDGKGGVCQPLPLRPGWDKDVKRPLVDESGSPSHRHRTMAPLGERDRRSDPRRRIRSRFVGAWGMGQAGPRTPGRAAAASVFATD